MRKFLLLMLTAIVCATVNAEPISRQQAQQKAAAFLKQQKPQAKLATTAITKAPRRVNGQIVSDQAYYYVFNTEDNQGYVIASGDDVAIPILAYSDEGTFDEENIPDNMRAFLKGYEREIAWAIEHGYQVDPNASQSPIDNILNLDKRPLSLKANARLRAAKTDIPYMVTATWDQTTPYNTGVTYGTKANQTTTTTATYTGCVATAMAQVMHYWGKTKGFNHGSTAIPAYSFSAYANAYAQRKTTYYVGEKSALSAFSWSNMPNSLTSSSSTAQKTAVGQLMEYCGASVNMEYTYEGSGASETAIAPALINYFGYDKGIKYVKRSEYTISDWEDLIYQELALGRPVLLDGVDFSELVGHEFVCDGYQVRTNKFHINWGWGLTSASSNGYFALSALAPGSTGSGGTSTDQGNYTPLSGAVIGIQPPVEGSEHEASSLDQMSVSALYLISPRTVNRDTRSSDADICIRGVVFNTQTDSVTYDYCLGIYNEANELVDYNDLRTNRMGTGDGFYFNHDFSFGAEMPYGTYKIIPICRVNGTDEWFPMQGASARYIQAVINKETVALTPSMSIKINSVSSEYYTTYQGTTYYTNTFNVTNDGLEAFTGTCYLANGESLIGYFETSDLAAGRTADIQPAPIYSTVNIQQATSDVFLLGDDYGIGLYYTINYADIDWDIDWEGNIDNDLNYYHDTYKAIFTINNKGDNAYNHDVTLTLFEKGKAVSTGKTIKKTANVPAKGSLDLEFEFTGVNVGTEYDLQFTYYEGTAETTNIMSDVYGITFTMAKGISALTEEGYLIYNDNNIEGSVEIPETTYYVDARYSDKAANIGEGGRTNTVYLLKKGFTIPEALSGKNIVVGSTAENITISDDEEFYTPVDFTAANVTYKRTFYEGCDADSAHWTTIMLPFKVENITCDDQTLDWYRSAEDLDKNFWLMDFTSETDGKANFTYTESIEANHPYIITVPSNAWGQKWNLVDKEIAFSGQNAEFKADMPKGVVDRGGKYDFIGRTYLTGHVDKYCMNEEGAEFEYVSDGWMFYAFPFRGYFVAYYDLGEESNVVLNMPSPLPTAIATFIGDVNKDGNIDVADITALTNILVNGDEANVFDHDAADVNQADGLTSADISALVDLVLEKTPQQAAPKRMAARKGQRMQKSQMRQGLSKTYPSMRKKEGVKLNNIGTLRPNTLHKK